MFDKNYPLPIDREYGKRKYPFAQLQPGESVLYPCETVETKKVSTAAYRVAKYHNWQFIVRRVESGVRVWRI
jgi:hypothetical protein